MNKAEYERLIQDQTYSMRKQAMALEDLAKKAKEPPPGTIHGIKIGSLCLVGGVLGIIYLLVNYWYIALGILAIAIGVIIFYKRSKLKRETEARTGFSARSQASPVRSQVSPVRPQASPARPQASPVRPQAPSLLLTEAEIKQLIELREQVTPLDAKQFPFITVEGHDMANVVPQAGIFTTRIRKRKDGDGGEYKNVVFMMATDVASRKFVGVYDMATTRDFHAEGYLLPSRTGMCYSVLYVTLFRLGDQTITC